MRNGLTKKVEIEVPIDLHENNIGLIIGFSEALANKLHLIEKKKGYSDRWKTDNWMDECRFELMSHIKKGDPIDVANYCAFLWYRGELTYIVNK